MNKTPLHIFKGAPRSLTESSFRLPINKRIFNGTYVLKSSVRYSQLAYNSPSISKKKDDGDSRSSTIMSGTAPVKLPNFLDPHAAYQSKTNWELIRAIIVLKICQISFLVDHGSKIIECSYRLLGKSITNAFIGPLFFQQFCAGEDFKKTTDSLRRNGIQSILDYCAEAESSANISQLTGDKNPKHQKPINQPARVYRYYSEAQCDRHRDNFLACIKEIRDASTFDDGQERFMAMKVTALGNPQLLQRISSVMLRFREELSTKSTGIDDFTTLSKHLSSDELHEIQHVRDRVVAIASEAAEHGIKLLLDAEQTWVQPAIDHLVLNLQEKFNDTSKTDFPVIFQTYQCYLKGAIQRIEDDVKRSQRMGYHFGAKLVRGAYMHSERQRARELRITSPIHDTIEDTHASYDGALEFLLSLQQPRIESICSKVEIMIATHNQKSVEKAIQLMIEKDIARDKGKVHFAQLLGMSDNLSFPLGKEGYSVFKYVPYGKVEEAMPYLSRRVAENRDVLKGSKIGLQMNYQELIRRLRSHFIKG